MQPLRHPVSGAVLDSKSAFRAITRESGCVELGNDAPTTATAITTNPADVRADVVQAMQMHEQGYRTPPLQQAAPDARIYESK